MSEEKENAPERLGFQEDLARMGIDEEGIFNFLHDAIGQDVGTEVLREFSNSDHFAELLDVVTTSLSAGTNGRSQRTSTDRNESTTHFPLSNRSESIEDEASEGDAALISPNRRESSESNSTVNACDTDNHKDRNKPSTSSNIEEVSEEPNVTVGLSVNINKENEESEVKDKENLRDDCPKDTEGIESVAAKSFNEEYLVNETTEAVNEKYTELEVNNSEISQLDKSDLTKHTSDDINNGNDNPGGSNDTTSKCKNPSSKEEPPATKKQSTFVPFSHPDFSRFRNKYSLQQCSVILCDIIKLGSIYRELNQAITVTVLRDKVKETSKREKRLRFSYAEKLNTLIDSNVVDNRESKKDFPIIKKALKSSQDNNDEEKIDKKKSVRREIYSSSDSSSDVQVTKKKNESSLNKKDDPKTSGAHGKNKNEYSAGGTRILPFERKRIPAEENRPRKFDKFENIRKLKENKKGSKKENAVVVKIEPNINEKTFASSSFRIPKKKDGKAQDLESKVVTPLSSQYIPAENLQFERCRKTKPYDDRKDKTDFSNAQEGKSREAFLSDVKIEIELVDEPDSWADDFGNCAESQDRAESDVKVSHLVLGVATFLREHPELEWLASEEPTTSPELLVVKIAWWFKTIDKDPHEDETYIPETCDTILSSCDEDDGSDISFLGHVSNPGEGLEDCQINEVSSSCIRMEGESDKTRDPNKVDEFCGCSLLQAKYRVSATGDLFQNIFDLRNGANYDKENFQAKCNLCNELIVGKINLAIHVRKTEHRDSLLNTSLKMAKSDGKTVGDSTNEKGKDPVFWEEEKVKDKNGKNDTNDFDKNLKSKVTDKKDVDVTGKSKETDKKFDRNGKTDKGSKSKINKVEMETTKTSTGLTIKVPIVAGTNRKRSRSKTKSPPRRRKSKSPRGRSPIQLVCRSPLRHSSPARHRPKRRSRSPRKRSRSPRRRSRTPPPPRRRRSSSAERVEEFLARTNRGRRSRSPLNISKRQRRSRSRSPKANIKMDNREFHEKLALTVDGKWTSEMERKWNLMETEQNMYKKEFQERQKLFNEKPEDHPNYAEEWTAFWEKRYQEVEKSGKDPDTYDYVVEWKDFWLKRVMILLQIEGEMKQKEIKIKYGMDYDSLRKIRFAPVAETSLKVEVDSFLPSSARGLTSNLILNFPPPQSISDKSNDDRMSKSMSISDDGIHENKVKGGSHVSASATKPNVTVEDIKSTWESLTGQKIGFSKSDAGSSSVASYDFDGFDLVQVLRLMCQIDQTLGIYAQEVQEYFRMAEELEISKRNKSYSLLNKKEFVELLFKCRDKFMNVIRANVVARDVLKSINLTVYALNAILDSPQCQKFKPIVDPAILAMDMEPQKTKVEVEPVEQLPSTSRVHVPPPQDSPSPKPVSATAKVSGGNSIAVAVAHLSVPQKSEIALIIAKEIVSQCGECISDASLMKYLSLVFAPLTDKLTPETPTNSRSVQQSTANKLSDSGEKPLFPSSTMVKNDPPATRVVGTALPPMPSFGARAASPPPKPVHPLSTAVNPFRGSGVNSRVASQYHPYGGGGGFGRGRSSSPTNSGRRSPFSSRIQSGSFCNPAPNSQDQDSDEEGIISSERGSSCNLTNSHLIEAVSKLSCQLLTTKESGIFSPPSSISVSSDDLDLGEVPTSVKLPPGILNLIRKDKQTVLANDHYSTSVRNKEDRNSLERRRDERKSERRTGRDRSSSDKRENNRRDEKGRSSRRSRYRRSRSRSRGSNGYRRERRYSRRSRSSSISIIGRVPPQSPSQRVNVRGNNRKRSPSVISLVSSGDDIDHQRFQRNVPSFEKTVSDHRRLSNSESNRPPASKTTPSIKPSRGVSAIFWETSSISGAEGNGELESKEDAFTDSKNKARKYRQNKVELEPGELPSSAGSDSTEYGGSPLKSKKMTRKSKKKAKPISSRKEIIVNTIAEALNSQDSFKDFDECMANEKLNPINDLNSSFDEKEHISRKIKLNFSVDPPEEKDKEEISDGSLTDFESLDDVPSVSAIKANPTTESIVPLPKDQIMALENTCLDMVSECSTKSDNTTDSLKDVNTDKMIDDKGDKLKDVANPVIENESLIDIEKENRPEATIEIAITTTNEKTANTNNQQPGLANENPNDGNTECDALSSCNEEIQLSENMQKSSLMTITETSHDVNAETEVPEDSSSNKEPTSDKQGINSVNGKVQSEMEVQPIEECLEKERANRTSENVKTSNEPITPKESNVEVQSLDCVSAEIVNVSISNSQHKECSPEKQSEVVNNEPKQFLISINKNIFEPMDEDDCDRSHDEDETDKQNSDKLTKPTSALELDSELETAANTIPSITERTSEKNDSVKNKGPPGNLIVNDNVDTDFLESVNNTGSQERESDDIYVNSHFDASETKILIGGENNGLVVVEYNNINVTESIEVTEEFLQ